MWADLLHWFGGAAAVAVFWVGYAAYERFRARQIRRATEPIRFEPAPEHDPEPKRQPGETRISTARLDRNRALRPVRRYDLGEDGADPFRR